VKPPQAIHELWKASDPEAAAADWASRSTRLVPLWWVIWWIGGVTVLPGIAATMSNAGDVSGAITRDWLLIASAVCVAIGACLAILLVRSIDRRQRAKLDRVTAFHQSAIPV
jgi:hypothetical protein